MGFRLTSVIPWSPLARGYLTRPHEAFDRTDRWQREPDEREDRHAAYRAGGGEEINRRVGELADEYGASMAQITIAWHLHTDPVSVPIGGVSSIEHLEAAVEAVEIELRESDLADLEEPYERVPITGHR